MSATGSRLTVSDSLSPDRTAATTSAVWFRKSRTDISLAIAFSVARDATVVLRSEVSDACPSQRHNEIASLLIRRPLANEALDTRDDLAELAVVERPDQNHARMRPLGVPLTIRLRM